MRSRSDLQAANTFDHALVTFRDTHRNVLSYTFTSVFDQGTVRARTVHRYTAGPLTIQVWEPTRLASSKASRRATHKRDRIKTFLGHEKETELILDDRTNLGLMELKLPKGSGGGEVNLYRMEKEVQVSHDGKRSTIYTYQKRVGHELIAVVYAHVAHKTDAVVAPPPNPTTRLAS